MKMLRSVLLLALCVLAVPFVATSDVDARGKKTFVYAHDSDSPNQLFGFGVAKDGTLTELEGSPFVARNGNAGCSALCQSMAYSKKRKMLVTGGNAGVSVWAVGKDGVPREVDGSPFGGDFRAISVAVAERGKKVFVFASDYNDDVIRAFSMAKDGTLTHVDGPFLDLGAGPLGMTVGKDRLFVSLSGSASVAVYLIGKKGTLTAVEGSPFATGLGSIYNVQSDAKGRNLYVGSEGDPEFRSFAVDKKTGVATPHAAQPTAVEFDPSDGFAVHKKGFAFAFTVSGDGTNDTRAFSIGKDGVLTPQGDVQSTGLDTVEAHALDDKGKLLVLASARNDRVATFAVDKKTRVLTPLDSQPIDGGGDPVDADDINAVVIVKR